MWQQHACRATAQARRRRPKPKQRCPASSLYRHLHCTFVVPQKEREAIMEEFKKGATRVLITTDVWARGLDVQQVLMQGSGAGPHAPCINRGAPSSDIVRLR